MPSPSPGPLYENATANGTTIGTVNGTINGTTNGTINGTTIGTDSGTTNGTICSADGIVYVANGTVDGVTSGMTGCTANATANSSRCQSHALGRNSTDAALNSTADVYGCAPNGTALNDTASGNASWDGALPDGTWNITGDASSGVNGLSQVMASTYKSLRLATASGAATYFANRRILAALNLTLHGTAPAAVAGEAVALAAGDGVPGSYGGYGGYGAYGLGEQEAGAVEDLSEEERSWKDCPVCPPGYLTPSSLYGCQVGI